MSRLRPINDNFLVEVVEEQWAGAADPEEGIRKGRVVEISDFVTFFGFHTFMFDRSLMDEKLLENIHDKYGEFVGKVIYWPERSESGTVVEFEGKKYIFMKWSSVMAVVEES